MSLNDFYEAIEPGVREIVRELRDAGINTESSCEHEMYVQCQTIDPFLELQRIYSVLRGLHSWPEYQVEIIDYVRDGCHTQTLTIWLEPSRHSSRLMRRDEIQADHKEDHISDDASKPVGPTPNYRRRRAVRGWW